MTDPALGSGAVPGESPLCSSGAGLLAASDEHPVGCDPLECFVGQALLEASVERDLPWPQPEALELDGCVGQ
jgi:hypothetical protein